MRTSFEFEIKSFRQIESKRTIQNAAIFRAQCSRHIKMNETQNENMIHEKKIKEEKYHED